MIPQDTDLRYLSGCNETDCVLVIHSLPDHAGHRTIMFTPRHDPKQEQWDGPR